MKVLQWIDRLNLSDNDLDVLTDALLGDMILEDTSARLEGRVTPEQVFAICRAIAIEEYGLDIKDMAPEMARRRLEINSKNADQIFEKRALNKNSSVLNGIIEDIVLTKKERNLS